MPLPGHRLPSRWFVRPAVLAAAAFLLLLAATGALGLWYWYERQAASHGAEHSGQVIEALDLVRMHVAGLESEKRRYLLTRDPSYLEPYGISDESVRGEIQSLQTLVADDPLQSLRAAHLALIVASKLRPMNELLATANTSGMEAALTLLRGTDEIQSQIDQMLDVEGFQLTRWQVRLDALQRGTIWFVAAAVGIAIIFAGAAFRPRPDRSEAATQGDRGEHPSLRRS